MTEPRPDRSTPDIAPPGPGLMAARMVADRLRELDERDRRRHRLDPERDRVVVPFPGGRP